MALKRTKWQRASLWVRERSPWQRPSILFAPSPQICCATSSRGAAALRQDVSAAPGNTLMSTSAWHWRGRVRWRWRALAWRRCCCPRSPSPPPCTCTWGGPHHWAGTCYWALRWVSTWSILRNNYSSSSALGLISLILSSAACWNHREQSTYYFC